MRVRGARVSVENAQSWISSSSSSRPEPTRLSAASRTSSPRPAEARRLRGAVSVRSRNASRSPRVPSVRVLARVEQVAREQLRVEARERLRPRHVVEAEAVAEREQRARLSGDERERVAHVVRRRLRVVDVGLRAGRRLHAEPVGLQRDLLPDRGLGGTGLERRGGELDGLAPAQLGVGGVRARARSARCVRSSVPPRRTRRGSSSRCARGRAR